MPLPRYIVLKSKYNGKCLMYVNEEGKTPGFLQSSGDECASPYAKTHVEPAKVGNGLVHLRCCYNNKYWVREAETKWWIKAEAKEPEEDTSKWSCTLFKPVFDAANANTLHLLHVQLNHYSTLLTAGVFDNCLYADSQEPTERGAYTFIDWESLVILPKHVTFKGDNGKYLCGYWNGSYEYNQFASTDIGDPTIVYEVYNTVDGSVRIKSNHFGKFWRLSPGWIWADSTDQTSNDLGTLFWPVKVDINVIALRSLKNNNFCKRLTADGKTNCLNAGVSSITNEARMEVGEPLLSRRIYNVRFRPKDSRTYNTSRVIMGTRASSVNDTYESSTQHLKFKYIDKKTRVWNANVSLKLGLEATFETGIPFIDKGEIKISAEVQMSYQWGETEEESKEIDDTYDVTLPPKTRKTVTLLATQGTCDVPFSYTQHDTLLDGKEITYEKDDGVFTGVNYFDIQYVEEYNNDK